MAEQRNVQKEEEIDYAAVAKAVLRVGKAAKEMHRSGLAQRAIHLLIHDSCKVGIPDIHRVLWAASELPEKYLDPAWLKKNAEKPL